MMSPHLQFNGTNVSRTETTETTEEVHSVAQSRNGGGFAEGESRIGRWCY